MDDTGLKSSELVPLEINQEAVIKDIQNISLTSVKKNILVETNHLSLNLGKHKTVIHYDVNITPDKPKNFLRTVVKDFGRKHFPNRYPAFDGANNLYSNGMLPFGKYITDEVLILNEGQTAKYHVQMKAVGEINLSVLENKVTYSGDIQSALQCIDVVFRSIAATKHLSVGRSYFSPPKDGNIIKLGNGMEMYCGFYQSTMKGWKTFLNIDVSHKAFPSSLDMPSVILETLDDKHYPVTKEILESQLTTWQIKKLEKHLKGLKVVYKVPSKFGIIRTYKVNHLSASPSMASFMLNKKYITIEDYFKINYGYKIKYPDMPTLHVGNAKQTILLPMELCSIAPGQVADYKINEEQRTIMMRKSVTSAPKRKDKIIDFLDKTQYNDDNTMQEFGFSVSGELEKIEAKVLNAPSVQYKNSVTNVERGAWITTDEFLKPAVLEGKWTIVSVDKKPPPLRECSELVKMILSSAKRNGMFISNKPIEPYVHILPQTKENITKQLYKMKNYTLIFVIIPNSGQHYSDVKLAAELNVGCLTQCIKSKTLLKLKVITVDNILLKLNSKLNGLNHCLSVTPEAMKTPCMIMGADVSHPGSDFQERPSIAAVTASFDPKAFRYNVQWRLQQPKTEIIEDLAAITKEQLLFFYNNNNGSKPNKIIFFRDGISESDFERVHKMEIAAIQKACRSLGDGSYEPKITFLVVQKRHHTRFFVTNPKDSEDKNLNVPTGTCVDTIITNAVMQDFYLVSHQSVEGVSKPTKYCILYDDNNLHGSVLKELTYHLCHMCARCNNSISYPAPTYYAHLAASRAKCYIQDTKVNLNNLAREQKRLLLKSNIAESSAMFFV